MPKARIAAAACLLLFTPTASAACSHGLAERALAEYEAQQPQREAARMLAKRQQSAPTNLAQQEGLTGGRIPGYSDFTSLAMRQRMHLSSSSILRPGRGVHPVLLEWVGSVSGTVPAHLADCHDSRWRHRGYECLQRHRQRPRLPQPCP